MTGAEFQLHSSERGSRMRLRSTKVLLLAVTMVPVGLAATSPSLANCPNGGAVFHGFSSALTGCGNNIISFAWAHHFAVQRAVGPSATVSTTQAGVDSGPQGQALGDLFQANPDTSINGNH